MGRTIQLETDCMQSSVEEESADSDVEEQKVVPLINYDVQYIHRLCGNR